MMKKWLDETSCNGVRELYESRKNICQFTVWLVIMVSMVSLSCHSIIRAITDYVNSPEITVIKSHITNEQHLPDMLLCYNGGFNVEKLKRHNVSDNLIRNLARRYNDFDELPSLVGQTYAELAEAEFLDFVNGKQRSTLNITNLRQFFEYFSFSCAEMITRRIPGSTFFSVDICRDVQVLFIDHYSPKSCLLLTNNGDQVWASTEGGLRMTVRQPVNSTRMPLLNSGFSVELSERYIFPSNRLFNVPLNVHADIVLKRTIFNRSRKCTNSPEGVSTNHCMEHCFQKALIDFCKCRFVDMAADSLNTTYTYCTIFSYRRCIISNADAVMQTSTACCNNCTPTCQETAYDCSVTYTNYDHLDQNWNSTSMNIGYQALQYMEISEVEAFTIDMAVGNIGGIAGLYLGCSIVTIIQFFYYLIMSFIKYISNVKNVVGLKKLSKNVDEIQCSTIN